MNGMEERRKEVKEAKEKEKLRVREGGTELMEKLSEWPTYRTWLGVGLEMTLLKSLGPEWNVWRERNNNFKPNHWIPTKNKLKTIRAYLTIKPKY